MSNSSLTIAFDPGGTTGVCIWYPQQERYHGIELADEWHGKLIWSILNTDQPSVVVYEDFKIRPNKTETISLEYIGIIRLWCELNAVTPLHHGPSAILPPNGMIQDPILRHNNAYFRGMKHARDAARHLIWQQINHFGEKERLVRF